MPRHEPKLWAQQKHDTTPGMQGCYRPVEPIEIWWLAEGEHVVDADADHCHISLRDADLPWQVTHPGAGYCPVLDFDG